MSHPVGYSPAMKLSRTAQRLRPIELTWSHCGDVYRVSAWPELTFSRLKDDSWQEFTPDPASFVFASAAIVLDRAAWENFLSFLPAEERALVETFKADRLGALAVLARCPAMRDDLRATPALVSFLASHTVLRGTVGPRWEEINAIYDRAGIYGLLEWLGLPASPQTLAILEKIEEPHVPRRLLEPLRTVLWEPETIWFLQQAESISERQIHERCFSPLAA